MTRSYARSAPDTEPDTANVSADDLGWDSNQAKMSTLGSGSVGSSTPMLDAAGFGAFGGGSFADPFAVDSGATVARARNTATGLATMLVETTSTLVPAYVRARDALDSEAVAELGGRLVASVAMARGTRSALGELVASIPHRCAPGSPDPSADLDVIALEQRLPTLDAFAARMEALTHDALVPHTFAGAEVAAGAAIGGAGPVPVDQLAQELSRTFQLLELAKKIRATTSAPESLDQAELEQCRLRLGATVLASLRRAVEPWASRPIDLAFLKAAMGPGAWTLLNHEPGGDRGFGTAFDGARPEDLLTQATARAEVTGWTGDVGRFDLDTARMLCMGDDEEGGLFALRRLYSADRATRPKLLEQMAGFLDAFCDKLGSDAVQALFEDLPVEGFDELKAQLARHLDGTTCVVEPGDGKIDLGVLPVLLADVDDQRAEMALDELGELDREPRTRAIEELHRRGRLDPMLKRLGWAPIKELHDSLAGGHGDIKSHLQGYFIGRGKFGPSLASEWESHESSLFSLVNKIPYAGKAINVGLDFATFGFNSSYGQARDANTRGEVSDAAFERTRNHLFLRTAAMAAVSLVTGGAADKFARGAGAGATLAGATAGMVGGVSGLATSDAYNVFVSGEQEGFSSFEDYVKTAVLGAGVGGVLGRVTEALSGRSSKYTQGELPAGSNRQLGPGDDLGGFAEGESRPSRIDPTDPYDLSDPRARRHVLDGDDTGGGHAPGLGKPAKTEFPAGWSEADIMVSASDVVTDPAAVPAQNNSPHLRNAAGVPNRHSYFGVRDGVMIKVVYEPATQRIVSTYAIGEVGVGPGSVVHQPTGVSIRPLPRNPGTPAPPTTNRPSDYQPGG